MLKKGLGIILAMVCLLSGFSVYATEPQPTITEAYLYTGTLYYCDEADKVVVLRDVDVVGTVNQKNTKTAVEAEYNEMPIVGPAIMKNQSEISLSDCNYYPDSKVRVLITRDSLDNLRVLRLWFV